MKNLTWNDFRILKKLIFVQIHINIGTHDSVYTNR